ncbi:hypothetical protein PROFUN_11422 [Planoprotostelium fungivorum]|uniref:Uncharacterized protein n=1 Tax=Planoprotostelium fungivorum TaxID=1890364 RepID=A0A2P6NA92_9EUKA|nr:hypothetical protein PROFUN_11422 [Planoprotostelium fungivorum]
MFYYGASSLNYWSSLIRRPLSSPGDPALCRRVQHPGLIEECGVDRTGFQFMTKTSSQFESATIVACSLLLLDQPDDNRTLLLIFEVAPMLSSVMTVRIVLLSPLSLRAFRQQGLQELQRPSLFNLLWKGVSFVCCYPHMTARNSHMPAIIDAAIEKGSTLKITC